VFSEHEPKWNVLVAAAKAQLNDVIPMAFAGFALIALRRVSHSKVTDLGKREDYFFSVNWLPI
jgi:hypothetical protein